MELESALDRIQKVVEAEFHEARQVLSFEEFFEDFAQRPRVHLRTAAQYLLDAFDHFGTRETERVGQIAKRYRLFDLGPDDLDPFDTESSPTAESPRREGCAIPEGKVAGQLAGQERAQNQIYQYVTSFARRGTADKMLLLHGPNGSGKTTLVESMVRGLEIYSRHTDGALYTFNWVFSERDGKLDRIGFDSSLPVEAESGEPREYAHLDEKDVTARFRCELSCPPIFLVPSELRREIVEAALERSVEEERDYSHDYFLENDLCQKCKQIHDSLLVAYQGDWRKVVRHVQVVRFQISKRYRRGAVSIEPQGNTDAGVRAILTDSSYSIPPQLRNVSLFEPLGDLIDANRGVLEYSDFLKRPLEMSKYLLTTCERGTINLAHCMAYLDVVIFGTANEKPLSMFKRSPDFSSFKGRMELIPVPYLLRYSAEAQLYRRHVRSYSRGLNVTPHVEEVAALWAVLTRLLPPNPENYEGTLGQVVDGLTPLEKARLYDAGETPERLGEDERKRLRSSVLEVRSEYQEMEGEFEGIVGAEYEGRRGVSPREMMTVLAQAAELRSGGCLSPMAVFDAMEDLLKDTSLYDFLRLPPVGEYRDARVLLEVVRREYYRWVTEEVYNSIHLIDESEYDRVFHEYFREVKAFDAGEKVLNPTTGRLEPPNEERMESIEEQVGIKEDARLWRSNILLRIAAWSLDHVGREIDYKELFPEIYRALRSRFYAERNRLLSLIEKDILRYGTDEFELLSEAERQRVEDTLARMKERYGYCEACAREVLAWVLAMRPAMEARDAD